MFKLALCQIYNEKYHGKTDTIQGQYLCEHIYKKIDVKNLKKELTFSKNSFSKHYRSHYKNDALKPEIVMVTYLSSGECICIKKTFWISVFQKLWKKFNAKYKNVMYLRQRELRGF